MVVQQLAKIQFQLLQLLKRINPKNMAVLRFQPDVLTVNDGVFHAIEQQLNSSFFLWVWHDVKNVHPVLIGACQ